MLNFRFTPSKIVLLVLFMMTNFGFICSAQINFYTGISTGFLQNDQIESAVKNYNQVVYSDQLTSPLKPIKSFIGFEIAVRSRFDLIAFDAGFKLRLQNNEAEGNNNANQIFAEKFNFSYNTIFIGTEVFMASSFLSIGANIGFDQFKIKHTESIQDINETLDQQNGWSSKFYIGINFEGSGTTKLILRPFYQMDWTGKKLNTYFNTLGVSNNSDNIHLNQIGISLIFANGA